MNIPISLIFAGIFFPLIAAFIVTRPFIINKYSTKPVMILLMVVITGLIAAIVIALTISEHVALGPVIWLMIVSFIFFSLLFLWVSRNKNK